MANTQAIDKGPDFDKVWAAIEATNEQIKATEALIKANAEQMKDTDRRVGELSNRFGEIVEYMIVPGLVAKFRELNFEFEKTSRDVEIENREYALLVEIDAFLENGDKVMVVEIKSKPNSEDVSDHVVRMEKLRKIADLHGDTRKYLGAIAGVVFGTAEKTYALKKGFYVIEPSGETFNITVPEGNYRPREW